MISNCLFDCTRCLKASTAKLPFSAISTEWPYFSRILTASFWLTRLSSASKMSNTTSLGAETGFAVFDSRAAIKADARSCEVTGVVTWELILLSKHHLTAKRHTQSTNEEIALHSRLSRGIVGARRTIGMYRRCSCSRMVSVWRLSLRTCEWIIKLRRHVPPLHCPR